MDFVHATSGDSFFRFIRHRELLPSPRSISRKEESISIEIVLTYGGMLNVVQCAVRELNARNRRMFYLLSGSQVISFVQ